MIRSAASKVMWVGRATVFLVGLAVILALVFGAASTVSAHTGNKGFFHLGHKNVSGAVSTLVGKVATGSALVVKNPSGGSALGLQVSAGQAPLTVNASAGKATNLDADKLDGKDSADLVPGGTLPAGTTIRGHFEMDGNATDASQLIGGESISFGYTLPSVPVVRVIQPGTTPPAECPGTIASPQANPGNLCVYVVGKSNVGASSPTLYNSRPTGANMYSTSAGAGSAFAYGIWAVTAPAAGAMSAAAQKQSEAPQQRPDVP